MSSHEDRVSSAISEADEGSDPRKKLEKNAYYKRLQQQLAKKKQAKSTKAVTEKSQPKMQAAIYHKTPPKLSAKSTFKWKKDEEGQPDIEPKEKQRIGKPFKVKRGREMALSFLGYKIDFSGRMNEFMEKYQKNYIDSKSHNFFLSKFAEVKMGMLQVVLGLLGVSTEKLKELQKAAVGHSVEENLELYAQNEYNAEMMTLFGSGKKDKGRLKVFDELRQQLTQQMQRLGRADYYSKDRVARFRIDQVRKIQGELLEEEQNLRYLKDVSQGYASIVMDNEDEPLNYEDVCMKLSRLKTYVHKVQSRLEKLKKQLKPKREEQETAALVRRAIRNIDPKKKSVETTL